MKLRNKKTGKIADVESLGHAESLKEKYGYQVTLYWKTEYENLSQCKDYDSLAELNEEWEDYEPKAPLIKDEKARKAVRAWAEANDIEDGITYLGDGEFRSYLNTTIDFAILVDEHRFDLLKKSEEYTIAELCGEEG